MPPDHPVIARVRRGVHEAQDGAWAEVGETKIRLEHLSIGSITYMQWPDDLPRPRSVLPQRPLSLSGGDEKRSRASHVLSLNTLAGAALQGDDSAMITRPDAPTRPVSTPRWFA